MFAFLPLRSYGFRFIVQGDFDLPSSRECVTSDSPWNQWLREQVPGLFLQALQDMRVSWRLSLVRIVKEYEQASNKKYFVIKSARMVESRGMKGVEWV